MIRSAFACATLVLTFLAAGCTGSAPVAPSDAEPITLAAELNFASVLGRAPMTDTARVAGVQGGIAIVGLLNQTPPCFGLTAGATKAGAHIVVRLLAEEVQSTCATFAAGAFDYDVALRDLHAGAYDVDVLHRTRFRDGRVVEATVGTRRVDVP